MFLTTRIEAEGQNDKHIPNRNDQMKIKQISANGKAKSFDYYYCCYFERLPAHQILYVRSHGQRVKQFVEQSVQEKKRNKKQDKTKYTKACRFFFGMPANELRTVITAQE